MTIIDSCDTVHWTPDCDEYQRKKSSVDAADVCLLWCLRYEHKSSTCWHCTCVSDPSPYPGPRGPPPPPTPPPVTDCDRSRRSGSSAVQASVTKHFWTPCNILKLFLFHYFNSLTWTQKSSTLFYIYTYMAL